MTDYRVVDNPLKRVNLNNHSPLQKESDGSLKIAVAGAEAGGGHCRIELVAVARRQAFHAEFRTYVPKEIVAREWAPPALERQR